MKKTFYNKDGRVVKTLTLAEVKEEAKQGNPEAIRELVDAKGGFSSLSQEQKDKVTQLLLGYDTEL